MGKRTAQWAKSAIERLEAAQSERKERALELLAEKSAAGSFGGGTVEALLRGMGSAPAGWSEDRAREMLWSADCSLEDLERLGERIGRVAQAARSRGEVWGERLARGELPEAPRLRALARGIARQRGGAARERCLGIWMEKALAGRDSRLGDLLEAGASPWSLGMGAERFGWGESGQEHPLDACARLGAGVEALALIRAGLDLPPADPWRIAEMEAAKAAFGAAMASAGAKGMLFGGLSAGLGAGALQGLWRIGRLPLGQPESAGDFRGAEHALGIRPPRGVRVVDLESSGSADWVRDLRGESPKLHPKEGSDEELAGELALWCAAAMPPSARGRAWAESLALSFAAKPSGSAPKARRGM